MMRTGSCRSTVSPLTRRTQPRFASVVARLASIVARLASIGAGLASLIGPRPEQVVVHGAAGGLAVAPPDGLVDASVCVGRVAQVAVGRALRGGAPALVVERGHHLDERGDDRIAGRGGDAPVKVDVVDEKHLAVRQRGEKTGDLVGESR